MRLHSTKAGVYVIRNSLTGRCYVGKSVNPPDRWSEHRASLRRGEHYNSHLQADWLTYGETAFEFELVERVSFPEQLSPAEHRWIAALLSSAGVYNLQRSAIATSFPRETPAVYVIENAISGRCYVGQSATPRFRFQGHVSQLRRGKHYNGALQADWLEHGPDAFRFKIVEIIGANGDILGAERRWIHALDESVGVYNQQATGIART